MSFLSFLYIANGLHGRFIISHPTKMRIGKIKSLKPLAQDSFLRHNLILFCGSMMVAVFNYLYHPILGRMVGIEDFGEIQTLISLFTQYAIIIGVFRIMAVNVVSNLGEEQAREPLSALYKTALILTSLVCILLIVLSPLMRDFFRFHSNTPFVILAFILLLGTPQVFAEAMLQGRHRFKELSMSQGIVAISKLILAVLMVYAGWSVNGAIGAILVAELLAILYLSKNTGFISYLRPRAMPITSRIRYHYTYALLVFTVSLSISFLLSADLLAVKHYFSEKDAGFYGGISIIAKIIFFATASVANVLLPSIRLDDAKRTNHAVLRKSLYLVLLAGGAALLLFAFFPTTIISLLLGRRYLLYAGLLPSLSLSIFLISLINLLFSYMLAVRNGKGLHIALAAIILMIGLEYSHHDNLGAIVGNSIIVSTATLTALVISLKGSLHRSV
jgi:O-antigen/teichoic acid export membrane protein